MTKPALTAEEWNAEPYPAAERGEERVARIGSNGPLAVQGGAAERPDTRHAVAALALWNATFGFGWEDVDLLRGLATWTPHEWPDADSKMRDLADRIAALLPPREGH